MIRNNKNQDNKTQSKDDKNIKKYRRKKKGIYWVAFQNLSNKIQIDSKKDIFDITWITELARSW